MGIAEIINTAKQAGCELLAEGEYIRITNTKCLPALLKEKIREHKAHILKFLNRDIQAKRAGFMIGLTGQVYTRSLSKNSIVFIEQIDNKWEAWRETYQKGKCKAVSVKIICSASTFEYVLLKTKNYFDYIERKWGGNNEYQVSIHGQRTKGAAFFNHDSD